MWLATREKGHSDNCVKCRLGSACAFLDHTILLYCKEISSDLIG